MEFGVFKKSENRMESYLAAMPPRTSCYLMTAVLSRTDMLCANEFCF